MTEAETAWLAALPAGARQARLEWVCTSSVERRGRFDKDEQGEVFFDRTSITGWRTQPDPAVHRAGSLSFFGIDTLGEGVLTAFPGPDRIGSSITALTLEGRLLVPTALESLGRSRAWEDLTIWAVGWSLARARELLAFPALRGLALHTAGLGPEELGALAGFVERLEDLTLTNSALDPQAVSALAERFGSLTHLDLSNARLGPAPISALAPKLRRARGIKLLGNELGDEGLRALIDAQALEQVEDLWLSGCALTDASARALAEASPPRLKGLWLDSNRFTDDAVAALVRAPLFARLEGVSLYQRGLTDRSRALLENHPLAGCLDATTRLPGVGALWFEGRPLSASAGS